MRSVEMLALRARLLPLFAALLLALPGAGRGAAYLFCHGMGRVVDKCCCPSKVASAPAAEQDACGARVQAPDCCERVRTASAPVTAASREKASADSFASALPATHPALVVRSDRFEHDVEPEPVEARTPPPRGPPLFIANCAFLT